MSRAEFRSNPQKETFSPNERYRKELTSHITAIQRRFDQQIADDIGFNGSIFEAFKASLRVGKNEKGPTLSIDRETFPNQLAIFIAEDKMQMYHAGSTRPSILFHDKKKESHYYVRFDTLENTEIKMDKRDISSLIPKDIASLRFYKRGKEVISSEAAICDYHNFAAINVPTKRTVGFLDTSDPLVSMRIGQEKNGITVEPLIYGDMDEEGNATLFNQQGLYTSVGRPQQIDWNEKENQFRVHVRNEKFNFPIIVNPHSELIYISRQLGI
jgi:hypothetical protein